MIELKRFEIRPERYPFFCQWELTCRCNLRCVMCYTDCFNEPGRIRRELATEEIFRVMDELRAEGVAEICFTGGEPMARPDFFAIHERARAGGFLTTVFTNGTLIDERAADRFAELPPHRVEISLHAATQETFEAVTRGPGSFEKCLRAIRLLLERRIRVVLKATAMTLNEDEILAVKKYADGLGVHFRMGEAVRPALDGSDDVRRFDLPIERLLEIEKQDPAIFREACADAGEPKTCRSGETSFHIDAYGMLQLCSGNRRQGYDLRKGSFREGFYRRLPAFHCPRKSNGWIPRPASTVFPERTPGTDE